MLIFIHKLSIEDIHPNIIMKSRNIIIIKDVFSLKKAQENYLFKRINDADINNYHQYEDEVEPRSKMKKKKQKYLVIIF